MGACSSGLMLLMLHQATVMEERCYLNISDLRLKTFRVMITNDAEFICMYVVVSLHLFKPILCPSHP